MIKLNGVIEKIRGRKVIAAIVLVSIIAFSVVYALTQMKTGFAVLTTPPPGIPGPYYVTAEAKIYGPVVDLAAIKSKMDGTYASDYTYVQWGTNPFYRVYVDNTIQEVYYGELIDVMDQLGYGFAIESNLNSTLNVLVNNGAVDLTSIPGQLSYYGNMPGVFVTFSAHNTCEVFRFNTTTTGLIASEAHTVWAPWPWHQILTLYLNGTENLKTGGGKLLNTTIATGRLEWEADVDVDFDCSITIYLKDIIVLESTAPHDILRTYIVEDSPGTGFVSKSVSPASPLIGSNTNILVRFDPPVAKNVNLTDLYPNAFGWTGDQVVLEKYRIGIGLVASASLSVTPTPVGSNMKITITYDQATSVLQSLLSDEYIHMRYTLTAPSTSGEYTLPAATMSYSIPLPQT